MREEFAQQIRELLLSRRKIEAIKLYRGETGAGLAEAREAIEHMRTLVDGNPHPTSTAHSPTDLVSQIVHLLQENRRIEAVKLYRDHHSVGLRQALESVNSIGLAHGVTLPASSGGATFVAMALAVVIAIAVTLVFVVAN